MDEDQLVSMFMTLELSKLDEEWVEMMYSTEYTEEPDIDLNLSTSLSKTLQDCIDALHGYLQELSLFEEIQSSLLHSLAQAGITSKVIKSWLHYIFFNGLKLSADFQQKLLCLQAVNLYFLLLRLPGMNASELHQPIIFEKSLDSLLILTHTQSHDLSSAMQRKRKGKEPVTASRKRRKHDASALYQDSQSSSQNCDEIVVLSDWDVSVLLDKLSSTLHTLCLYLASSSLRAHEGAVKQVIQSLVKVAIFFQSNCPVDLINYSSFKSDGSTTKALSLPYQSAVYGLFLVVSVKHGDLDQVSLNLFRFIIQILLMKNATGTSIPRAYYQNSEIFRRLVCHLYDVYGNMISHNITILTQNLIAHCPDRTEFRNHCSVVVACILNHMPLPWFAKFSYWLKRVAVHVKISYRSNAVAVFAKLLCQPQRQLHDEDIDEQLLEATKHEYMLSIVVGRLMDVAPSVRSRALAALVEIMEAGEVSPTALHSVASGKDKDYELATPMVTTPGVSLTPPTLHSVPVSTYISNDLTSGSSLLSLLTKCSLEMKSMVRKAAVHALEMSINYGFIAPTAESLSVISVRCRDSALLVRKFSLGSITSVVLHHMDSAEAVSAWARGVLPALHDIESSVQEKALKHIEELMFDGLFSSENKKDLAWRLMDFIASPGGECIETYFKAACKQWKQQSKLNMALIYRIVDKLSDSCHSPAAWTFLQCYTLYKCDRDTAVKMFHAWTSESLKDGPLVLHINSIKIVGQVCNDLPDEMKRNAFNLCVAKLKSHKCPIQLISYLVDTILHLIEAIYHSDPVTEEWPKPLMRWGEGILNQVDEFLYKFVILCVNKDSSLNDESLIHQLHVAGNIGKHCAKKVSKRLILTIQALLTNPECLNEVPHNTKQPSQDIPQSQPLSHFAQTGEVPQNIRAHALINLGKLCLNNGMLAKKCVPAFVRELDTSGNDMIKVNILIVLADLCVLQTQLVDMYIPDIANCLRDDSVAVRRNALVLINSLLKKDYVKWRGSLVFKFLALLCDDNEEIQELVQYSLINQTLQRSAGDVFFRHFVESIFYLNAYTKHNVYNRFSKSARELKLFDFSGTDNINHRTTIYHYMLDHMDDEHRIKLMGKLCTDIIDAVVDGTLPLNQDTNPILADTLSIISSQKIKLRCMKPVEEDQIEDEVQANAAAAASNAIKQKIISQVIKQNLLENIVPIIIALKNKLVSNKSHMVRNVMESLKEIMKDYKTEVQDILAADKQLAAEIEFDLKRFDREENLRKEHAMRQAGLLVETPAFDIRPGHDDNMNGAETIPPRARRFTSEPTKDPAAPKGIGTSMKQGENSFHATPSVFHTPAIQRPRGLGIEVMLNSARKAMSLLKVPNDNKNPRDCNAQRAISTPARKTALTDLTFSNLNEISVIAPSVEASGT